MVADSQEIIFSSSLHLNNLSASSAPAFSKFPVDFQTDFKSTLLLSNLKED